MTPQQRTAARRILSGEGQHPDPPREQALVVWRYPARGLWVRWLLYQSDAAYWVRRTACQAAPQGTLSTRTAEAHVPTPTVWPLFSTVSGLTLPLLPLEDAQLPRPGGGEHGLDCGGLRLAWAPGTVDDSPWANMAGLHRRLIACFEDVLPPLDQRSPST